MKLIDVLINGNWIWHEDDECVTQDPGGEICAWGVGGVFFDSEWKHPSKEGLNRYLCRNNAMEISTDYSSAIITKYQYQSALAASQKVEWSVDGLPPVGCEVEYIPGMLGPAPSDDNKPIEPTIIKIVAHEKYPNGGNDVVVGVWMANSGGMRSSVFSPRCLVNIRSEADKKRDAACRVISDIIDENRDFQFDAKKIYDAIAAGKITGVKLED